MARLAHPLTLLGLLALCGTLAGCGVRGPLQPPPGAEAVAPQHQAKPVAAQPLPPSEAGASYTPPSSSTDLADSATPRAPWQKQKHTTTQSDPLVGIPRPNQPFVLDGLL